MKNLSLRNIAQACDGIYFGEGNKADTLITEVVTDSRKITKGCLFVAIKGARVDGHDFIEQAYLEGAVCVLTEKELSDHKHNYIKVESTTKAIRMIAQYYRENLNIKVVGITGSVGKTSTKEMIASVLSQKYKVLKTLGNFNNALGVPFTLFRLTEEDEVAVVEMGISDFGEMDVLSKIAKPDICVFTNIGMCHLEQLKDRDGILKAKTEMFNHMNKKGHIIVNGDDDKLSTIQEVNGIVPMTFGYSCENDVYLVESRSLGFKGTYIKISTPAGDIEATIPIPGKHMIYNAMAGALVGAVLSLTPEQIKLGIETVETIEGRNNVIETEYFTIIDDCYNANPVSMRASIDLLTETDKRKVCIIGDMGELGKDEEQLHRSLGEYIGEKEIDFAIFIGKLSKNTYEGFQSKKAASKCAYYDDVESFLKDYLNVLHKQDYVLIKASHFMNFTQIVNKLKSI